MLVKPSVDVVSSSLTAVNRFSDIVRNSEQEEIDLIALDIWIVAIFLLSVDSALIVAVLCICSFLYRAMTAAKFVVVVVVFIVVAVLIIVSIEVGDVIAVSDR